MRFIPTRSLLGVLACALALAALLPDSAFGQYYRSYSRYGGRSSRSSSSTSENPASPVGQVYAVPEEDSNTVLIIGPPRHFEAIQKILEELDTPPAQVLIQAMFVEVQLTDAFDWDTSATVFDSPSFIKALDQTTGRTFSDIATAQGRIQGGTGEEFTFRIINNHFEAALKALKTITNVNVISRPQVLVSDNQEAQFFVGENTPFISFTRLSSEGSSQVNTIDYQDVGITLEVTPHINPDGVVTMDVYPESSRRSESTVQISEGLNASVFPKRSAETIVSIHDGHTVVIGGLIEDSEVETVRKVPLLGSIPILGWAFRGVNRQKIKTELIIFITPTVVTDPNDLQKVSDKEKERAGVSTEPPKGPPKKKKHHWWW